MNRDGWKISSGLNLGKPHAGNAPGSTKNAAGKTSRRTAPINRSLNGTSDLDLAIR